MHHSVTCIDVNFMNFLDIELIGHKVDQEITNWLAIICQGAERLLLRRAGETLNVQQFSCRQGGAKGVCEQ